MMRFARAAAALAVISMVAAPANAAKDDDDTPQLVRCEESIGSIALVEGDQAGWSEWGLGSPRALINTLVAESGCFTIDSPNDDAPARFLVTAIAGSAEEVDQGMELAKGAATQALVQSGAAGSLLGGVPGAGALLGMFGGFGGKKKTVAAGPARGQPGQWPYRRGRAGPWSRNRPSTSAMPHTAGPKQQPMPPAIRAARTARC